MAAADLTVGLREYHFEDSQFTYILSDVTDAATAATAAAANNYVDLMVSIDANDPATVKLAPDNGELFGRIEQLEWRAQEGVCYVTVSKRFIGNVILKTGETPAIGSQVIGAGNGQVKSRAAKSVTDTGTSGVAVTWTMGSAPFHNVLDYDGTAHTVTLSFGV